MAVKTSAAMPAQDINRKGFFKKAGHRFLDGGIGTKLSHLIMGAGNFRHKQFIKGTIYLAIQVLFILFMVLCPEVNSTPLGYKALLNLRTLGTNPGDEYTNADNSMLMLLFGVVTIGVMALYLVAWYSNIKSSYKADLDARYGKGVTTFRQDCASLLDDRFHVTLLTPTLVGVGIFTVLPTLFMILIAFTNYDRNTSGGQNLFTWVGLDNFIKIFSGQGEIANMFWPVFSWTLIWAVASTVTCYLGGILLALLINRKGLKGKKVFRTIFILTIAMPQFISLLAMRYILSNEGPFQTMLMALGWIDKPVALLSQSDNVTLTKFIIILVNMWIGIPYTMLMTSGILMNIPTELYEAAKVDGAKPLRIFFRITFPYIFFITTPYLISSFIGNLNSFNVIFMLTGGAPISAGGYKAGQTDLLVTWLYKMTVDEYEYNIGAVIGILTFLITSTVTLLTYRRSKSYKEEDTFQ